MEFPIDGSVLFTVSNVELWTKQGTSVRVGGGFTTTVGQPSLQLLPSTNTVLGYYNGQMLARAAGDGTGIYAGLTAGALVNFDPASTDTGQVVWNGWVICDAGLKQPLPINTTYVGPGTLEVATQLQGWVLRQQFLYAGGTPATDVAVVETAVTATAGINVSQFQCMNSSNAYETVFGY